MPAFPLVQALKRALVVVDVTVEEVQWLGVVASPEPSEKTLQCGHLGRVCFQNLRYQLNPLFLKVYRWRLFVACLLSMIILSDGGH